MRYMNRFVGVAGPVTQFVWLMLLPLPLLLVLLLLLLLLFWLRTVYFAHVSQAACSLT
jgi:hypothetical protein